MSDGNWRTFEVANGNDESNGGGLVLSKQQGPNKASSALTYSIEVCQGPDCTGLGGGVAILEIEELVKEHHYHTTASTSGDRIRVVGGGCRDFCSVGPNVHVLVRDKSRKTRRKQHSLLESFASVNDAPSCEKAVHYAIGCATKASNYSSGSGFIDENKAPASSARSMMTRKAERTRWGALKDVSRTIAKGKRVVTAATGDNDELLLARKQRVWTETCHDRIQQAVAASGGRPSQRDQRRTERLLQMATEKLERICLQLDNDSDSSSSCSSSSSSDVESSVSSLTDEDERVKALESKIENLESKIEMKRREYNEKEQIIEVKRRINIEKELIETNDKIVKDLQAQVKKLKEDIEEKARNMA